MRVNKVNLSESSAGKSDLAFFLSLLLYGTIACARSLGGEVEPVRCCYRQEQIFVLEMK